MLEKWYAKPIDAIEDMLGTRAASGLTPKAARIRRREDGDNLVFALPHTPSLTCAAYVLSDVSMLLLVLTTVLAAIWGEEHAGGLILGLLALHCAAAIFTYIKSRRIFESTAVCAMPRVRVLRGGQVHAIDARLVVRGDVILLGAGDVISCDARLVWVEGLEVLEYSGKINGKPQRGRVTKDAGRVFDERVAAPVSEQTNMVFAGSVVLAGEGRAIVVETGESTFFVATEGQIPLIPTRDRLPELEAIKTHCGRMSLCMLVMILPLTLLGMLIPESGSLLDHFLLALALAVSSMSELTAAIGYIIVGAGILHAAKNDEDGGENTAILPYLADLPAIARMDTLVLLDDTALTVGRPAVTAAFCGTSAVSPNENDRNLRELYACALLTAGMPESGGLSSGRTPDPEKTALVSAAEACGVHSADLRARMRVIDYAPADSANPFHTILYEEQRALYAVCSGDAAALLARCTRTLDPASVGGTATLRRDRAAALLAACTAETAAGGYAVAYARRSSPYNTLQRLSVLQEELTLIGVLVFRDPLGQGVAEEIGALADAGVRTLLMADRPSGGGSIEALACAAGILRAGTVCRAGEEISTRAELCIGYSAAARRAHLSALRESGAVTVGLGTRVGDLPLMQACSVSATCTPVTYGAGRENRVLTSLDPAAGEHYGSELLKKNAGLLVRRPGCSGGGIAGIASARLAARRILCNLASAMRCLLSAQVMRMLAVILLLALKMPVFTPQQLLFGGLILDFGAILVCAFDRGGDDLPPEDFFRKPWRACLPQLTVGAVCGICLALLPLILQRAGVLADHTQASGFVFVSMLLAQLVLLFVCRRPGGVRFSRIALLWPIAVLAFLALCFLWSVLGAAFGVCALSSAAYPCLLIAPLLAFFGGEVLAAVAAMRAARDEEDADGTP